MAGKEERKRQVRCLNCFQRFAPSQGTDVMACPHCNTEWRLTWSGPDSVKIRGPVWSRLQAHK